MITRNIGKNTLGDNNKMKVHLKTYNRSTHNLSTIFRNTQSVGTLVPFVSIPMCKDDTFKIKLTPNVLTHPTIGPGYRDWETDRKSTRLNSSHSAKSRMPSSA